MSYDYGFDDETNDAFIIFKDGTIIYVDEIESIIIDIIETLANLFIWFAEWLKKLIYEYK